VGVGGYKWRKNFIDNKNDMEIKWPGCKQRNYHLYGLSIYLSLAFMQINLLNVALFLKCLARIIKTHLMCEKIGQ